VIRKFNGGWIIADSEIPIVMEGWRAKDGENPYEGTLESFEKTINACDCATLDTNVQAAGTIDGIPAAPPPSPTP
jgi:hypothetical protein